MDKKSKAKKLYTQGLSLRQVADKLEVSKSTIHNWVNDGKANASPKEELAAMQSVLSSLPPAGGSYPFSPVQGYVGILSAINRFYTNPDEAVRASRENARNMLRNLDLQEPLQARRLAVAEMPGHVEPPDKKNKRQLFVSKEIQNLIDEIPYFHKLKYALLNAVWFGKYGAMLRYRWDYSKGYRRLAVSDWTPLHGDSIYDKFDTDEVGILVGLYSGYPGTKQVTTENTNIARAHVLSQNMRYTTDDGKTIQRLTLSERDSVLIHRHDFVAGDFFEPESAGGVKGLGLRSVVYWTHYICSEIRGWMLEFMERVGTGITIVRYLRGNQESYDAAKTIAESNSNQAVLLFPVDMEAGATKYEDIERIEPSATGLDNMLKIVDGYFGAQMRRYIVGQDATSRPISTGIGSSLAQVHENTFGRIIKADAINLQETLTRELVHVIQKWTFPGEDFQCRYVLAAERPNVLEVIQSAKLLYDMGAPLRAEDLRTILGFARPDVEDEVLQKKEGTPNPFEAEMGQKVAVESEE